MRARSAMTRAVGGLGPVDDGDVGAALEQRVGGGEPAHPEPRDEHAQAGPVGVAVGEVARAGRQVPPAHPAPTTHSA